MGENDITKQNGEKEVLYTLVDCKVGLTNKT